MRACSVVGFSIQRSPNNCPYTLTINSLCKSVYFSTSSNHSGNILCDNYSVTSKRYFSHQLIWILYSFNWQRLKCGSELLIFLFIFLFVFLLSVCDYCSAHISAKPSKHADAFQNISKTRPVAILFIIVRKNLNIK